MTTLFWIAGGITWSLLCVVYGWLLRGEDNWWTPDLKRNASDRDRAAARENVAARRREV